MSQGDRAVYRPQVRIGNWFEDLCLQQDKISSFKMKRDTGELLIEKARKLFDNFHREVELEAPKEHVRFGAVIQLVPPRMRICDDPNSDLQTALSININETVVRHSQSVNENCELTIAPSIRPCARNSFRIVSADENDRTNEVLKYKQPFRLESADLSDDPLYLYTSPKSINLDTVIHATYSSQKRGEINLPLGLKRRSESGPGKDTPAAHLNWFCQHIEPSMRFESDGIPLKSNSPLVITHCVTNKNLAAENIVITTLFGPEFLVSVQDYKDIYRREQWQNIWMIRQGHRLSAD